MLFIATVEVVYHPYMESPMKPYTETHPVEAKDEDEARSIVQSHYDDMSTDYESYYEVISIKLNPTLTAKYPH